MKRALRPIGYIALTMTGIFGAYALPGCSGDDSSVNPPGTSDSGASLDGTGGDSHAETGSPDAGTTDSGSSASSRGDTGSPDTGSPDTGLPDTGAADTGTSNDANADAPTDAQTDAGDATMAHGDGGTDAAPDSRSDAPASDATGDAGVDAADAPTDALAQTFCQSQSGLAFCADFDEPNPFSLDGGVGSAWTAIDNPSYLSVSTARAVSLPDSLLVMIDNVNGNDRSARLVKTLTPPNGVTQAIFEFDVFVAGVPTTDGGTVGGLLTDFQFQDGASPDIFGFRISVFGNASGFDHAAIEHLPVSGGTYLIQPLTASPDAGGPDHVFSGGAWQHVKMVTSFLGSVGDAGNQVSFQLYLNRSSTPAWDQPSLAAPFAKAPFARLSAGIPYTFSSADKTFTVYYDNVTLKVQ